MEENEKKKDIQGSEYLSGNENHVSQHVEHK